MKESEIELRNFLFTLYDNAYLTAKYDSIKRDSISVKAYLKIGEMYKWAKLGKGNVDEGILSDVGFREKIYRGKPLYYKEVRKLQEKILFHCENNGFPFASIKLDSISIGENLISAQLNLTKNLLVKIDSIEIKGSAKISPVYIYNYLSIKPGDLYNESLVKRVSTRLKELQFVKESVPFQIIFTEKYSKLVLSLDKKNASQFDGILGILPDNKTGKVLFTGDVHLKLQNSVNHGELIDINWRRLQIQTQDLKARLTYPFIFRTPFGIDFNFKLYKKDTTYLDVNPNLGIQYLLSGGNYLKVFVNRKQSTLLSTKGIEFQTTLPPYADVTSTIYGIGFKSEKLDYRFNPRKGYTLNFTAGAGNKIIKKNLKLNPVAYNGVKLNTVQYSGELEFGYFFPLKNRSVILTKVNSAYTYNSYPASTFQNELFRIGGLKSLRGFDEESINATGFAIFTLEYRYLLEENSYLYLFTDNAYVENISRNTSAYDAPYGFGAGISFETKAGIFSLNYALGSQKSNPIDVKGGKVHFGIVNYF